MTYILISFILSLILLGSYSILCLAHFRWTKWIGASTLGVVCLLSAALLISSLGQPRPAWSLISWQKYTIVDIQYDINKAIYLWGYMEGSSVPVAVVLPWNLETAKHIADKQHQAKGNGGTMMLNDPSSTDPITITQDPTPSKTE